VKKFMRPPSQWKKAGDGGHTYYPRDGGKYKMEDQDSGGPG
jgi:hypothetical protein